jgi:sugar phosphate isomerase/epimerase
MRPISRRDFLAASGIGIAAAALHADPLGLPIGCQTYPVRDTLGKDLNGTLHQLASIGYKHVEMCSPPGYANAGYGPLVKMKASEIRDAIHSAGLGCESCHHQFAELKTSLDDRIAYAKELGLKQMVLSTFGLPNSATLSDWARAADDLNRIGEQVQKAGMQMGFHNHNFEFKEIDGVLVYDHLMQRLDAKLVQMQFQVSVISLGYEAATYLNKYPGRFLSLHLQDWSSEENKQVPVGKGVVNWPKLFAAAKTAGVRNYFVELGMDALQPSYDYLHAMRS